MRAESIISQLRRLIVNRRDRYEVDSESMQKVGSIAITAMSLLIFVLLPTIRSSFSESEALLVILAHVLGCAHQYHGK